MNQARNRNDELLLRRYLLGRLAEEEQRVLEQQLMTDRDLFNHLLRAEEELIDEYVCGQISSEEAQAFESRFLDNARHWDDLQFAEVLQRQLAKHYAKLSRKTLPSDGGPE
jgi:anti-sigma-K factor RskA